MVAIQANAASGEAGLHAAVCISEGGELDQHQDITIFTALEELLGFEKVSIVGLLSDKMSLDDLFFIGRSRHLHGDIGAGVGSIVGFLQAKASAMKASSGPMSWKLNIPCELFLISTGVKIWRLRVVAKIQGLCDRSVQEMI